MNILCISLEQSKTTAEILDWLTAPEIKGGKNEERHWMVNTNTQLANPHGNQHVELIIALLYLCQIHNFPLLMIRKNE